jgi:hypothetical protein
MSDRMLWKGKPIDEYTAEEQQKIYREVVKMDNYDGYYSSGYSYSDSNINEDGYVTYTTRGPVESYTVEWATAEAIEKNEWGKIVSAEAAAKALGVFRESLIKVEFDFDGLKAEEYSEPEPAAEKFVPIVPNTNKRKLRL